ncbi:hypothetical protein J6590_064307 [Homalodisca vitripennis]|nr:hypothetical protein J6590_064307 [Homalodisca vitripennis]
MPIDKRKIDICAKLCVVYGKINEARSAVLDSFALFMEDKSKYCDNAEELRRIRLAETETAPLLTCDVRSVTHVTPGRDPHGVTSEPVAAVVDPVGELSLNNIVSKVEQELAALLSAMTSPRMRNSLCYIEYVQHLLSLVIATVNVNPVHNLQ